MGAAQLEEPSPPLKIRAFFGLPLPEAQRTKLAPFLAACAATAPDFRWIPASNLHLTLHFLGAVEASVPEGIAERLVELQPAGFELELSNIGTFNRKRLARVVWLQVHSGVQQVRELAARVEEECVRAGLAPEARVIEPHLTLARARPRDGAALPRLPEPPRLKPWRAEELILYRSHLGRGGAVYEPLRRIRLS